MNIICPILTTIVLGCIAVVPAAPAAEPDMALLEQQFRELPMDARRLIGPLFWLHGDESRQQLERYVRKVAEGGNGCFTAESRPHNDWLGPGWYRDLAICLEAAREHNLKMWIFDEKWWPSQSVGGKVPARYAAKRLDASAVEVQGPRTWEAEGHGGNRDIATVAGRVTADGKIESSSLIDLTRHIHDGKLSWQVPPGKWKVMKFTYVQAPPLEQTKELSVDGASKDCVDWYLQTVYQPHYDHFKADFGKTIVGFFYDEPETQGDWGTELNRVLARRNVDWKKAYVAHKFELAGEEQIAAGYQYLDALAEAWGRTMYGGITNWCHERGVKSIGHFMEHSYFLPEKAKPQELQQVLADAGIYSTLKVLAGETGGWLHVLHRVKAGQDVFLVCNQNHEGAARRFKFRATAAGEPECWDAVRNEIVAIPFRHVGEGVVEFSLVLEPLETVLIVFQPKRRPRPLRIEAGGKPIRRPIPLVRDPNPRVPQLPPLDAQRPKTTSLVAAADPFRAHFTLPGDVDQAACRIYLELEELPDNSAAVSLNGTFTGGVIGRPSRLDITRHVKPGRNTVAIEPLAPHSAKLVLYRMAEP